MATKPASLEVGSVIRLDIKDGNVHHFASVKLMGYADAQTLIVSLPPTHMPLATGAKIRANLKQQQGTLSFPSEVLEVSEKPNKYLKIRYPVNGEQAESRKNRRIAVKPRSIRLTMLDGEDALQVDLADLSIEGARLTASKRLGYIDDKFMIDMNIPHSDTVVTLPCVIRYIRNDLAVDGSNVSTSYHHGVRFDGLEPEAVRFIESFVAEKTSSSQNISQ